MPTAHSKCTWRSLPKALGGAGRSVREVSRELVLAGEPAALTAATLPVSHVLLEGIDEETAFVIMAEDTAPLSLKSARPKEKCPDITVDSGFICRIQFHFARFIRSVTEIDKASPSQME
jgi:hypothetical protein